MRWLIVLLLAGCSGEAMQGAPQPGETIYLPPIEWRVVNREELRAAYVRAGMPLEPGDRLSGFVGTVDGRTVVYTLAPTHVDDQATLTLGHEILHVAIGDYHK